MQVRGGEARPGRAGAERGRGPFGGTGAWVGSGARRGGEAL